MKLKSIQEAAWRIMSEAQRQVVLKQESDKVVKTFSKRGVKTAICTLVEPVMERPLQVTFVAGMDDADARLLTGDIRDFMKSLMFKNAQIEDWDESGCIIRLGNYYGKDKSKLLPGQDLYRG